MDLLDYVPGCSILGYESASDWNWGSGSDSDDCCCYCLVGLSEYHADEYADDVDVDDSADYADFDSDAVHVDSVDVIELMLHCILGPTLLLCGGGLDSDRALD